MRIGEKLIYFGSFSSFPKEIQKKDQIQFFFWLIINDVIPECALCMKQVSSFQNIYLSPYKPVSENKTYRVKIFLQQFRILFVSSNQLLRNKADVKYHVSDR